MRHKGRLDSKAIITQVGKSACGCEFLHAVLEATCVYMGMCGCAWVSMGVHVQSGCTHAGQEKAFPLLLTSPVFGSINGTGCRGAMETW